MTRDEKINELTKEFDKLFQTPTLISPPRLYFTPGNLTDEMVDAETKIHLVPDLARFGITLDGLTDWSTGYLDALPRKDNYVRSLVQEFVASFLRRKDDVAMWTGAMMGVTLGAALTLKMLEIQARHGGEWKACNQDTGINKTNEKGPVN
jgi:hypothetical protein